MIISWNKLEQKVGEFPKNLRIFGLSFDKEAWGFLSEEDRLSFRASALPAWLRPLVLWAREAPSRWGSGGWWWFRRAGVWVRTFFEVWAVGCWVWVWDSAPGCREVAFGDPLRGVREIFDLAGLEGLLRVDA